MHTWFWDLERDGDWVGEESLEQAKVSAQSELPQYEVTWETVAPNLIVGTIEGDPVFRIIPLGAPELAGRGMKAV